MLSLPRLWVELDTERWVLEFDADGLEVADDGEGGEGGEGAGEAAGLADVPEGSRRGGLVQQ